MMNQRSFCLQESLNVTEIKTDDLKDRQDIVRFHDYYTNTYNAYREECRRNWDKEQKEKHEKEIKAYKKIYAESSKAYEGNYDGYLFKIPENPEKELSDEGVQLGHCVGGYQHSVLTGNTNIIFLREESMPNKSFMTIEVNNGRVVQIHGAHNAWMGSCERYQKAIPAVMHWLYDRDIKCHQNILTSKAMGYSSHGAGNIELPKVPFNVSRIIY